MPTIYEQLVGLIDAKQPCVLATLVGASGSSPQNTGARVVFLPNGRIVGTIGGGCMEAEARRVGLQCLRTGERRLFELRLDDDFGWDDGLICGGRVSIFLDPAPAEYIAAYRAAVELSRRRERSVLLTVVQGPEELLASTLLLPQDDGSEPVGCPPALPAVALAQLRAAAAAAVDEPLARARTARVAGDLTVYVEPIVPRPTAVVAGAGHVGAALAQILALCGFETVVVDDRPAFASADRLPFADRVVVDDIPRFIADFPLDEGTYLAIVTRGHRHDAQVLRAAIHSPARYIGMIGSKRKICVIFEELLRQGHASAEELRRVHSPMGLTLGDREVGEIAVSIAAEIVAVRNGHDLDQIRSMTFTPPFLP